MDLPLFHPGSSERSADKLAHRLRSAAHYVLIVALGLLPILFIPSAYLPFSTGKTLIAVVALGLALLFLMMAALKEGVLAFRPSLALFGIWSVAGVTLLSALLSGDARDSLWGDGLDSYTAFFVILLALVTTLGVSFFHNRQAVVRLYGVIIFSGIVLSLFHIIRLVFGSEVLTLGMFASSTSTPIGSWNGLAIFYGLVVLLIVVALERLPLSSAGRIISYVVMGLCLALLAIINFTPAWWVLGGVAGVLVLYRLVNNLWSKKASNDDGDFGSLVLATAVLVLSLIFIFLGARIGGFISEKLGVSYLEVRPSFTATVDIGRDVMNEDLLLGAGSNRFSDAWRIHKDPGINQTIFWNTPFESGFSYVTTTMVNTGLLGILAYLLFFVGLGIAAVRYVLQASTHDRFWHFIGLSSLIASLYFWFMAIVYVPPPSILILTALTTGIFLASYMKLVPTSSYTLSAANGRIYGVAILVVAIATLSGVGYVTYAGVNQAMSVYKFNEILGTVEAGDDLNTIDDEIVNAFDTAQNDAFAATIAFHQLSQMRTILTVAEPTAAEQQRFQASAARGIEAAQTAANLDASNPYNHQLLGQIYAVLALVGVEGASDRASESFAKAKELDPHSPVYDLLEADLALGRQDAAAARTAAEMSVQKKGDFTEALFFLAQLDINEGNVERAIAIVAGVAQLEPQNPARRYQLGVLLASNNQLNEAVAAFESAVALDPQYANARYFLALGYAEQGRTEEAIRELRTVRELNESNAAVDQLIAELEQNGELSTGLTGDVVGERDPEGTNVTEEDLENDLVTSSNPVPQETAATEESAAQ